MKIASFLLITLVATALRAVAQENEETVITSDRLEFDYREFVVLFEGNVDVRDPEFGMQADRMFVFFEGTNEVKQVKAMGNVRVQSADRTATCNTAVYLRDKGQIVMTGDAVLRRQRDQVNGDQITIWLDDQRVLCVPGRLVIYPEAIRRKETAR
ncbi:MAG: hypothetical protein JXB13_05900 [Phycisphaerae bacterium]|nr:hypothetical protein [Phycisphaerae bacterium]